MDFDGIAQQRRQYETDGFDIDDCADDPVVQFTRWFADQRVAHPDEPNAMALATASTSGRPSARSVLLKEIDTDGGLVWFTNYESAKAQDLAANPDAEVLFAWIDFARQIRVHGSVVRLSAEDSDEYFATRPRGSQLGAWASPQSMVIADRAALERRLRAVQEQFGDGVVPRPDHWGGFRLQPTTWEFWQGRTNRLHDRIRYTTAGGGWRRERLAP